MLAAQGNQKYCCLCYSNNNLFWKDYNYQPLTVSCKKHLAPEILGNIFWQDSYAEVRHFCQKCSYDTERLLQLNTQLESINREISDHVNQMTRYITSERTNCRLQNAFLLPTSHNIPSSSGDNQNWNNVTVSVDDSYDDNDDTCNSGENSNTLNPTDTDPGKAFTKTNESKTKLTPKRKRTKNSSTISQKKFSVHQQQEPMANVSTETAASGTEECETKKKIIRSTEVQPHLNNPLGFECPSCSKKFSKLSILQSHDCEKPTQECQVCGKSFVTPFVLQLHMRSHTGEKPYKCETCEKCFSVKANLTRHIRTHTGEKPYKCEFCPKEFSDETGYIRHKRTHRDKATNLTVVEYKCEICSRILYDLGNFKSHIRIHTDKNYKCDMCKLAFYTEARLAKHKLTHADKTCVCDICGKTVCNWQTLRDHKLTHDGVRPFQCTFAGCEKSFRRQNEFNLHLSTHSEGETYVCETCGKVCVNKYEVIKHKRKHRDQNLPCTQCDKTFKSKHMLKNHEALVHSDERPFKCTICECAFKLKNSLKMHTARTKGNCNKNEFKCDICNKLFQYQGSLRRHQEKGHNPAAPKGESVKIKTRWNFRSRQKKTVKTEPENEDEDENSDEDLEDVKYTPGDSPPEDSENSESEIEEETTKIKAEPESENDSSQSN